MMEPPSQQERNCRMLIVGLGNGGCRAVVEMGRQWKDGPDMVAINTDTRDLAEAKVIRRLPIGAQVMKGMGTGGDPRVGRRAAESDIEAIRALFHDVDLVFLVVGLGGGTGTGAAPLVVEEARKAGALTLCFAMLPFDFEGQRRMEQARRGLMALEDVADGVICVPNQRLFEIIEDRTNITEAFHKADETLCHGVQAVWRGIGRKGIINLDFADVRALIQNGSGRCVFGCAEGSGPDKISMALQMIREDPLLKHGQVMANAYSYLVIIVGGSDLTLKEVDQLMTGIAAISGQDALAMAGVSCEPTWQDKIFVTILASEKTMEADRTERRRPVSVDAVKPAAEPRADDEMRGLTAASRKKKLTQATLFDAAMQGRFKGIDPTIVEGNNLDIPTFIRRGILIQKVRNSAF